MYNKNNNSEKKVVIKATNLYKKDNIYISPSLIEICNNIHQNKQLREGEIYQDNITCYINNKHKNSITKQYNPKIVNLYENGIIVINNKEYSINDFFIIFDNRINNFTIKCTDKNYNNQVIDYNQAVMFKDTTSFINLINNSNIILSNNRIIINDINIFNNIVHNWDGYLHSDTKETDSVIKKRIIQ